jgi:hypothetical protein
VSMSTGRWSELSAEHVELHREREILRHHDVQDIGSGGEVVWVGGRGVLPRF